MTDNDQFFRFEGGDEQIAEGEVLDQLERSGSIRLGRTYSQVREERLQQQQPQEQRQGSQIDANMDNDEEFQEVNLSQEEDMADRKQQDFTVEQRMNEMTDEQREQVEARRLEEQGADSLQRQQSFNLTINGRREGHTVGDIELITMGRISFYFLAFLGLKIYACEGFESYKLMYKECHWLFNWFAANIGLYFMNFVYAQIGRTCHGRCFTRRTEKIYKLIVVFHGFVVYFYGVGFFVVLNYGETSKKYFNTEEMSFQWHQYITFKILELFRAPLMFCCCFMQCLLCVALALSVQQIAQGAQSNDDNYQGAGGLQRSATEFWNRRTRAYSQKEDELDSCPICMVKFSEDENQLVAELECSKKHIFHVECIRQWVIQNDQLTCPICREPINIT